MTDRIASFVVVLERDTREDDTAAIVTALKQVRGVVDVLPVVSDINLVTARAQARGELIARIGKVLDECYV